jgi:hypothetical protein
VLVKQSGRQTSTTKLKVIVTRIVHQAMQGDYPSIRLLFSYAGLDRLLNAPNDGNKAFRMRPPRDSSSNTERKPLHASSGGSKQPKEGSCTGLRLRRTGTPIGYG